MDNLNDQKKEIIIKWFLDKLIKEHSRMLSY